jgi:hypothetical protein
MTMGVIGATTLGALLGKRWEAVPKGDAEGRRRALLGLTKVGPKRCLERGRVAERDGAVEGESRGVEEGRRMM